MSDRARSAPPDLPGYTFLHTIGGGGFADVYLYEQLRPSRKVAVKVLRSEHLSDRGLRQFETEADVMAGISEHPYIVTVYGAGMAPDGRPFIVMEHYPQPHFGTRARGGALPVAEAIRVAVQVSSAVHTAHEAGVLHRDIKPANILTSAFGRPGLTDFGISGVRHNGVIEAAEGVTVPFAPPEVLMDEGDTGSERSDVYSLAATLYALVTGRPPYWVLGGDNSDGAMISRTVSDASAPPPTGRDDSGQLDHLLWSAMATNASMRPPSALAFAQSLQQIELELKLSPTPIEVRGEVFSRAAPAEDDEEEDRTRRPVQVVHPDGPVARPGRSEPAPGRGDAGPIAPTTAPPATVPAAGRATSMPEGEDTDDPRTVRRHGTGTTTPAFTVENRPATTGPTDSSVDAKAWRAALTKPWVVAVAGLVAVAGVWFILSSARSGSDAQQAETEQLAEDATVPEEPALVNPPVSIDPPEALEVSWDDGTRTLTVRWDAPPQADHNELTYRVHATDPATGQPNGDSRVDALFRKTWDGAETKVVVQGLPEDIDPPCARVEAISSQRRSSDLSATGCPSTAASP